MLQQITGINVFLYYAPEIFKKLGSGTNAALLETVLVGAVNMTFTILAIWTVDRLGRKPLMLVGATGMGLCLLGLGMAAYWQRTELWTLGLILGYIACFRALRRSGRVGDPFGNLSHRHSRPGDVHRHGLPVGGQLCRHANVHLHGREPWLIERFHHGFPFWVYAAFCARDGGFRGGSVPETKGKTLEEIERSWLK